MNIFVMLTFDFTKKIDIGTFIYFGKTLLEEGISS